MILSGGAFSKRNHYGGSFLNVMNTLIKDTQERTFATFASEDQANDHHL